MQMTLQTLQVLDALLDHGDRYGYELCKETGLTSGTVYPILHRLEQEGWVTSGWVLPVDDGFGSYERSRRYYRLTEVGGAEAVRRLAQLPG
jgi:PadR family transcriptional regulator PadR